MDTNTPIRYGWLKGMYTYTLLGGGGTGLAMLVMPGTFQSALGYPPQDPVVFGLYGSALLASGLIAIPALRWPLKFLPLLLLQLVYKPVWLGAIAVPLFLKGQFPLYVVFISAIFVTYIIGNLIALPFSYLFSNR